MIAWPAVATLKPGFKSTSGDLPLTGAFNTFRGCLSYGKLPSSLSSLAPWSYTNHPRAESQSPSNSERKYVDHTARKPIDSKYDGLIIHGKIEYGAVEDSKIFGVAKWTSDSLKLAKLLHDQMRKLEREVAHDKDALGRFRCVGVLTAGLHCRAMYLQYGKGHVCPLKGSGKSENILEEVLSLYKLFRVLNEMWRVRETVKMSIHNLMEFHSARMEEPPLGMKLTEIVPAILPTCLDTDTDTDTEF